MRMSRLRLCWFLALAAALPLHAQPSLPPSPRVLVAPMKTSIYIGSVTLTTTDFLQQDESFVASYEAKVWPWFFWGETGKITIKLPGAELTRLALGQTIEFAGEAANHKGKPRTVTGRAQPATGTGGKIKVRVIADGIELIFNGTYQLVAGQKPSEAPPTPPSGK
jgi:hypothetical protein